MRTLINYAGVIVSCWLLLAVTRITGELNEKYVGCFRDKEKQQIMEPSLKDAVNLTIEICIQKCYNQTHSKMTFAALNNGLECICRDDFGQQLPYRNCSVKCSGDAVQNCGGNHANKFYSFYTVCSVGYFGSNCDQLCHCKRGLPCDRKTGICSNGCEEHWSGTSCNIGNIQRRYIGCYGDGPPRASAMDVKNPGGKTGAKTLTNSVEFCIEICSSNEYTYAGMQYAYDCHCGEKYSRYGNETYYRNQSFSCNYRCSSNSKQICGGNYALSVYYVCPIGFYGRDCVKRCQCADGGPCRFNGTCLTSVGLLDACKPGWTGSACNIRDCKVNNGDCNTEEQCETIDLGYVNMTACQLSSASHQYVGCYKDGNQRAFEFRYSDNKVNNTPQSCSEACAEGNYSYAGLQYGYNCFCGDSYDRYGVSTACNMQCTGDNKTICGGTYANSVYSVCAIGNYGRLCTGRCRCLNNERCFYRNGLCPSNQCEEGWTGPSCNIRVNDVSRCSSDEDCRSNETCSIIDVNNYTNISRCQCKRGFHRINKLEYCTDINECQSDVTACNPRSENCFNTIGSYRCEGKGGFVDLYGMCEECRTIGIILGTLLAISLLANALLVVCRVKRAKSRNPGGSVKPISKPMSDQHEINYEVRELDVQDGLYEHILPEQRRIVLNATSEYAELANQNDYFNVESSI